MIRQVIAKIDCGDEYCEGCGVFNSMTYFCELFKEQLIMDFDTPKVRYKRCDACKQAEAQAKDIRVNRGRCHDVSDLYDETPDLIEQGHEVRDRMECGVDE